MRRGLLAWSEKETPKATLEARVERVQEAMRDEGYDALLAYTHFPRPAAVSYLTHFIPYWNQGLMVMGQEGLPTLLVALSNRVRGWALDTCHVEDVICTPRIGADAAKVVASWLETEKPRIGVVEADRLPQGLAQPFRSGLAGVTLEDATELFSSARARADEAEIGLTRRAAQIADAALDEARMGSFERAAPLIGAVERAARLVAAEEVQIAIAPDLAADTEFRRLEGDELLGEHFAVRATVAYKGFWVRRIVSIARKGEPPAGWADAAARFRETAASLGTGADLAKQVESQLGALGWHAVAPFGANPLADSADHRGQYRKVNPGSIISLDVKLATVDGPWLGGGPILLAKAQDGTSEPLFA